MWILCRGVHPIYTQCIHAAFPLHVYICLFLSVHRHVGCLFLSVHRHVGCLFLSVHRHVGGELPRHSVKHSLLWGHTRLLHKKTIEACSNTSRTWKTYKYEIDVRKCKISSIVPRGRTGNRWRSREGWLIPWPHMIQCRNPAVCWVQISQEC